MSFRVCVTGSNAADGTAIVNNIYLPTGDNYYRSAMNSNEQLFSPISIDKNPTDASATPGFRPPAQISGWEDGAFSGFMGPTVRQLDPYFTTVFGDDGSSVIANCDYRIVIHDKGGAAISDLNLEKTGDRETITAVRTNASLRGPIIVSGWGFGLDDSPHPKLGNEYPKYSQFDDNLVNDRSTWKTGPVDLKWDDERQVWSGGHQIVCGVVESGQAVLPATNPCKPTRFFIKVIRRVMDPTTGDRSTVLGESLMVTNRDPSLEQDAKDNAIFVIAVRINYEWLPIWVGCPEDDCYDAGCGEEQLDSGPPVCL